jgi:hypothetical protein
VFFVFKEVDMHAGATLRPHQRGAQKLLAQYGDRLLYVRYRYDEECKIRWKTVELIVEAQPWEPRRARKGNAQPVAIQVAASEVDIRNQVKRAGGKWNPRRCIWELRYDQVVALGLKSRIVPTTDF